MHTITIELPINVSEKEAKVLLAIKLYEAGRVSLGQAARIAGYSIRAVMEALGEEKIPVFNYRAEDLGREIAQ